MDNNGTGLVSKIVEALINAIPVGVIAALAYVGRLVVNAVRSFATRFDNYDDRLDLIEAKLEEIARKEREGRR